MPWKKVDSVYGVAVCNFSSDDPRRLRLRIGDAVEILRETENWFFGRLRSNRACSGIFPASFVVVDPPALKDPDSVVSEVAWILREWISSYREYFVERRELLPLLDTMREASNYRSALLSGKLPAEDAKEIRKKLTIKTDFMNCQLSLDLTVRNQDGTKLDERRVSAVSLYKKHCDAQEAVQGILPSLTNGHVEVQAPSMTETFKIMLTLKSFSSGLKAEEIDLITSIYEVVEGKSPKPLCENFVYAWHQRHSKGQRSKVLFSDISKNDIANKKLYLITNVVTEGNYGNDNQKDGSRADLSRIKKETFFRKALGVAAIDITEQFTFRQGGGKRNDGGKESDLFIPFIQSGSDCESLESTFKRLINSDKKSQESNVRKLGVKLNIVFGGDFHNYTYHMQSSDISGPILSRKIGLPDVIRPSDVRNDLYITLVHGEFSRLDKRQDRNVEVTVELCDNSGGEEIHGGILPGVIGSSTLRSPGRFYTSIVYRHEAKPRWNEIIKVSIPVDQFGGSHLRFLFRHRSRSESKEKSLPWAMAFLKLVNGNDGTALKNGLHELLVYKIDKKFDCRNTLYLKELPHLKSNQYLVKLRNSNNLSVLSKDSFVVRSVLCSTKLTQNEGLLSLLKWRSEPEKLFDNLQIFKKKVHDHAQEVVKFLPDVLDALFSILMENQDSESNDQKVFKILIFVIQIVTDTKYQQFIPVLETYIRENFSATLAYVKLLAVLRDCVEMGSVKARDLTDAMKSLKYVFKFVVRSRILFSDLNAGRRKEAFEEDLKQVLNVIVELMFSTSHELSTAQEHCLRNTIQSIPDLSTVLDKKELSEVLVKMIRSIPKTQLPEQKMKAIEDLILSELFLDPECRNVMLPVIVVKLREAFDYDEDKDETSMRCSVTSSTETLGDILDLLSDKNKYGTTYKDLEIIINDLLRPVVRAVARSLESKNLEELNSPLVVTVLISILRQMSPEHFSKYVEAFNPNDAAGRGDLSDFISEVLLVFKNLITGNGTTYPKEWSAMVLIMNYVLIKALNYVSHTISDHFNLHFDFTVWNNFFESSVAFVVQPSLQLEIFSEYKRSCILNSYGDMRKEMAKVVRTMWFNLGQHKIKFIPKMVGPFLEMSFIPEPDLRKSVIPMFFDMMQCEFYSVKGKENKGNFLDFEREMIEKLDVIVESGGRGDEYFKILFRDLMGQQCESHSIIKDSGLKFVRLITRLLELLLEYRASDDNEGNRMSCIVNLLDFYKSVKREEMYVRYLKKIIAIHENCQNYSEAAFTLLQYTKLLSWTDRPLSSVFSYRERHPDISTNWALKEQLHKDIIVNFEKSHMWECAIKICEILESQYKEETFDYPKLAELHGKMAKFYNNIMTDLRPEPEYFRVAFYGRGFAAFLQNKTFVYRGRGYEKLSEFQNRILDQFPKAELMKTLEIPSEEETAKPIQMIQINKVESIMEEKRKFQGKNISQQITDYYRVNEVNKFTYSRPYMKDKNKENEFASLWVDRTVMYTKEMFPGVLQWFPVLSPTETYTLCPLENAIENMQKTNNDLRRLISKDSPINMLGMKIKGVINAAVNGGISKYEKAFFTEAYLAEHPEHGEHIRSLKNLIAEQIPDLGVLLELHNHKKPPELKEFHDSLQALFEVLKAEVEEKYGKRKSVFDVVRHNVSENRLSHVSDTTRYSTVSQSSYDNNIKSRSSVFSVINGITRKKSIVSHHNVRNDSVSSMDFGSPSVIITQDHKAYNRIVSGTQFLIHQHALTPSHSRSPSVSSNNRDSMNDVFEDDYGSSSSTYRNSNGGHDSSGDAVSVSSFDEGKSIYLKKKAPAPPPPSGTPPTPPKKNLA